MGYESKIIVVERFKPDMTDGKGYGDEIARFDLSKMGYETVDGIPFRGVFHTPIDFDLYGMYREIEKDSDYYTDCYGEHCKWATIEEVKAWLEKSEVLKTYRRAKLFYDFLCALEQRQSDFRQIVLVHFGY